MCDQQSVRSACAYAQSDQSLCLTLEYSMTVKLLSTHHLEIISLKGGCTGSLSLHLSKYHIVGNHMSRLIYVLSYVRYVLLMSPMSMFLLNVNKVFLICQYKPKGVQLGGFVGQFAWGDPENIVSGCGG